MRPLIVKQLNYDLTPVAGLALVGHHLKRLSPVFKHLDKALPVRTGVSNRGGPIRLNTNRATISGTLPG